MSRKKGKTTETIQVLQDEEAMFEKDGLPWQAYAMAPDREQPGTWKLPHHTSLVYRAVKGKIEFEHTVDWPLMPQAVEMLSLRGIEGKRVEAAESEIITAARHLATHYIKAGTPVPDALAVLI